MIIQKSWNALLLLLVLVSTQLPIIASELLRRVLEQDYEEADGNTKRELLDTRIVGGDSVDDPDKHPYFAEWNGHFCGGALIHDDLVLTAAHCALSDGYMPNLYFRSVSRRDGFRREIEDRKYHPLFDEDENTRDYDFLVLKLERSALVDSDGDETGAEAIPLNLDRDIPEEGDPLWAIGFGQTDEDEFGMVDQLRDVELEAFSDETCESQYDSYFDPDIMFCAGVPGGGKDTCQGDSGGPIVDINTNTLVGLVSFGIGCAREEYGGMNSRISYAAPWIEELKCSWSEYPPEWCGGSAQPTFAPTVTPDVPGRFELHMEMDDYPGEEMFTVTNEDTNEELHSVSYGDVPYAGVSYNKAFTQLDAGLYKFRISDWHQDGICCDYGGGDIWIEDRIGDKDVIRTDGRFGAYFEVVIQVDTDGISTLIRESNNYQPGSWPEFEEAKMKPDDNDREWPGIMPDRNDNSLAINIQLDNYADETSFTLKYEDQPEDQQPWTVIDFWDNLNQQYARNGELVSFEYDNLSPGWYSFQINDSGKDGLCCNYGSGWVTLTGPLTSQSGEKGLIWGNDGEFWGQDIIYFRLDDSGNIAEIGW